jgi:hypothetical protein
VGRVENRRETGEGGGSRHSDNFCSAARRQGTPVLNVIAVLCVAARVQQIALAATRLFFV